MSVRLGSIHLGEALECDAQWTCPRDTGLLGSTALQDTLFQAVAACLVAEIAVPDDIGKILAFNRQPQLLAVLLEIHSFSGNIDKLDF
jgi:hypothetical protein